MTTKEDFLRSVNVKGLLQRRCPFAEQGGTTDPYLGGLADTIIKILQAAHPASIRIGNFREDLIPACLVATHGDSICPQYHKGAHVTDSEFEEYLRTRKDKSCPSDFRIVTKFDKEKLIGEAHRWLTQNKPMTQAKFDEWLLYADTFRHSFMTDTITDEPVDLICTRPELVGELKSSGDTDTGKSASVVYKDMMTPYAMWGHKGALARLIVGYDNTPGAGESDWDNGKKRILKYLDRSLIMFEGDFLEKYGLPDTVAYEDMLEHVQNEIVECFSNYVLGKNTIYVSGADQKEQVLAGLIIKMSNQLFSSMVKRKKGGVTVGYDMLTAITSGLHRSFRAHL